VDGVTGESGGTTVNARRAIALILALVMAGALATQADVFLSADRQRDKHKTDQRHERREARSRGEHRADHQADRGSARHGSAHHDGPGERSGGVGTITGRAPGAGPTLFDQCAAGGAWHDTFASDATYAEPRIQLEAQEWFFPLGAQPGMSAGHTHLETCVPVGAVSGSDLRFDLRLRLHLGQNIPAPDASTVVKINEVEIRGKNSFGRDVLVDQFVLPAGQSFLTCAAGNLCETTLHFDGRALGSTGGPLVDLHDSPRIPRAAFYQHGFTNLGRNKQLRLTAFGNVYVNGDQVMRTRAGLRTPFDLTTCIQEAGFDCNSWQGYTDDTEGTGWFGQGNDEEGAYASVRYDKPLPTTPFAAGSTWEVPLKFAADPCDRCPIRNVPIVGYDLFVDPSFHTAPATPVVAREFSARISYAATERVPLTGLTPGLHRLVIILRQPVIGTSAEYSSTNHGILVIPFLVS
jgi:hypothetical protein